MLKVLVPNLVAKHTHPVIIQAILFFSLLLVASVYDIRKKLIPNSVCVLIAAIALITFSPVKLFGILAAIPLFIAALCKQGSIGGGDIKLTAAAGLVLGFGNSIAGLVIGLASLLICYAVIVTMTRMKVIGKKSEEKKPAPLSLPMAPFLSIGFIITYLSIF